MLTREEIQNIILLLNRTDIKGGEAEIIVNLKQKLHELFQNTPTRPISTPQEIQQEVSDN